MVTLVNLLESKRYPTDIVIALSWALFSLICVLLLSEGNVLRALLGIPLVLIVPGYLLVSMIWPGKWLPKNDGAAGKESIKVPEFGLVDRIVLSMGLSIVIVSLLGIFLDFLSVLITLNSIIGSIFIVIVFLGFGAIYARIRLPFDERYSLTLHSIGRSTAGDKTMYGIAVLLVALVIVSAALYIATPSGQYYTNFYIIDQSGSIANLTESINVSESAHFLIGIDCHEKDTVDYLLNVTLEDSIGQYIETLSLSYYHFEGEALLEIPLNFSSNTSGTYRIALSLTNTSTNNTQFTDWIIRVD